MTQEVIKVINNIMSLVFFGLAVFIGGVNRNYPQAIYLMTIALYFKMSNK